MKKKAVLSVCFLLVFLVILYLTVFARFDFLFADDFPIPTYSEMKNWRLYENAKFGFKIKYPENWSYLEMRQKENQVNFYPTKLLSLVEVDKDIPSRIEFFKVNEDLANYAIESGLKKTKYKLENIGIIKFDVVEGEEMSLGALIYIDGEIYKAYVWHEDRDVFNKMLGTLEVIEE